MLTSQVERGIEQMIYELEAEKSIHNARGRSQYDDRFDSDIALLRSLLEWPILNRLARCISDQEV